jgi:hypothetical protein
VPKFKVLELITGITPFVEIEKERVDFETLNIGEEIINEIKKEKTKHNLIEIKNYPVVLSEMMKYNPFDFKFFLNFTDDENAYQKFVSISGFKVIPKRYYWNCCNVIVDEPAVNIRQLHNSKIQNDNKCDYIFLEIIYDYKRMKLFSFKEQKKAI